VEKKSMQARIAELPTRIADLKKRSYLIAQEDPFVVIPLSFRSFKGSSAYTPSIGDYAVVICGDKMLPAIVGDYGPSEKCGEASLRIAREIDPKAGPYNRPVSDLKVTYLIFPGSAEKPRQPDYEEWHAKCSELLGKLGADPAKLHHWEDRLKAKLAESRRCEQDTLAALQDERRARESDAAAARARGDSVSASTSEQLGAALARVAELEAALDAFAVAAATRTATANEQQAAAEAHAVQVAELQAALAALEEEGMASSFALVVRVDCRSLPAIVCA
jgi:hypothetical protein